MDVKRYFERVTEKVNNMTDSEFLQLLEEAGLEECPLHRRHKNN